MLQSLSSDGDVSMMSSVLIITIYGHIWGLLESLTSDTLIAHILRGYGDCYYDSTHIWGLLENMWDGPFAVIMTVPIYGDC